MTMVLPLVLTACAVFNGPRPVQAAPSAPHTYSTTKGHKKRPAVIFFRQATMVSFIPIVFEGKDKAPTADNLINAQGKVFPYGNDAGLKKGHKGRWGHRKILAF
ncbi:MAG: hypothetical protein P8X55_11720 [Desulfosarcinaceae bacterium]|jgi:hypothetical protein